MTENRDVIGRLIRFGQYRRNAVRGGVVKKHCFLHSADGSNVQGERNSFRGGAFGRG